MENISLSIINLRTNKETSMAANQIFINKSPDFQRSYEAWDDKLRTRFIESMLLGRATNPIWTVLNDAEESEEILDGMHRITTALAFLNNEFSINKVYLLSLDGEKYNKKKFNDLETDDKAKIRNYNFIFNKLDSTYRNDKNKLRDMYEILNRSSITLNNYEFNKVTLNPLYDIVGKQKESFIKLGFFSRKDCRGNIDTEIIEMLSLINPLPNCWSSVSKIKEEWIKDNLGETTESVNKYIAENGEDIENKLIFMNKIIRDFYQSTLISNDKKIFKKFYLPYKFIISRCCYLIKNYPLFNRVLPNLTNKIKNELLTDNIEHTLECTSRNATFQKKILEKIDEIINDELKKDNTPRFFPKKMIQDKLQEQNNQCPSCKLLIKSTDEYEGDHIVSWSAGGMTVFDNLQVLHKKCHQIKTSK